MTDDAARKRAHAIFDPLAEPYLQRDGVDFGPMFGSEGLRIRGKVFAFVGYRGSLVVKVPEHRADLLVEQGVAERMEMRGRPMREWLVIDTDRAEHWQPLLAEAYAYLDEISP
jgi:TfoX/Sxy family transcriptional regulator of competence genes